MFQRIFLRPDAMVALEDPGVRKGLPRYVSILEGKALPKFHKTRKIPVDVDLGSDLRVLWKKHDEVVRKFDKLSTEEEFENNLLDLKIELAERIIRNCHFCEWGCKVDRKKKKGRCGVGYDSKVSTTFVHMGEEACISPSYTIFFCGCPLSCVYCQNFTISQKLEGRVSDPKELATGINKTKGSVRNINWVGGDPTPHLLTILKTLKYCNARLPSIWNSSMYMSEESVRLLEGVVDVYLADFRYGFDRSALKYSKVKNYWKTVTRNFRLANERAELLIRILVLPYDGYPKEFERICKWICENLGHDVRVNVMGQYRPMYKAFEYPELSKSLSIKKHKKALQIAKEAGLTNLV